MKLILFFLLIVSYLNAQKVEITADNFEADEKKHLSTLTGNVTLKKGEDQIKANKLIVKFNKKNRPIEYIATKNITFNINTDKQQFDGRADRLFYNPTTQKYELTGNVIINETKQRQKLIGDKIIIDRVSGKSKISGSKNRPVKFIFDVKEQ